MGTANLRRQEQRGDKQNNRGETKGGGEGGGQRGVRHLEAGWSVRESVGIPFLGVDLAILGVDIAVLGIDIAVLGVDIAILRRQKKGGASKTTEGGLRGREEGVVSRVRHLEAGWSVRESVDIRSHNRREVPCCMPIPGVRPGRDLDYRGIL